MNVNRDKLLKMKSRIEETKTKRDQNQGALEQLLKRLKTEHGCKDIKEADVKLKKLEEEEVRLQDHIEKKIKHLEETYEW